MFEINIIGRKATAQDADTIFEWANDEETRRQSFHTEKIAYESHIEWFGKKIADQDCVFLIFEQNNDTHEPVGSVRLDWEDNNKYLLNYQIAPKMRGMGYGKQMIFVLEKVLKEDLNMKDVLIEAEVKTQNVASCKCFESNHYSKEEKGEINTYLKKI